MQLWNGYVIPVCIHHSKNASIATTEYFWKQEGIRFRVMKTLTIKVGVCHLYVITSHSQTYHFPWHIYAQWCYVLLYVHGNIWMFSFSENLLVIIGLNVFFFWRILNIISHMKANWNGSLLLVPIVHISNSQDLLLIRHFIGHIFLCGCYQLSIIWMLREFYRCVWWYNYPGGAPV